MKNEFSVNQLSEYFHVIWSDIYAEECNEILEKHEIRMREKSSNEVSISE